MKKKVVIKKMNLSGISIVVNDIDGQPFVFKRLTKQEREAVKKIAGRYPNGWNEKRKKFEEKESVRDYLESL